MPTLANQLPMTHPAPTEACSPYRDDGSSLDDTRTSRNYSEKGDSSSLDEQEEDAAVEATLAWIPSVPVEINAIEQHLEKPVVIPRIGRSGFIRGPSPFLRAYSYVLESHGVPIEKFAQFLDNLSVAEAPSPPFAVINLTAQAASLTPELVTMIVTNSVSVVAMAASEAVTRYRRRKFLERVNVEYFAPRGLKVSLVLDKDLPPILDFPRDIKPLSPINSAAGRISLRDRRMDALSPYISELSTIVPQPIIPQHVIDKLSAKVIKRRISNKENMQVRKKKKLAELQSRGAEEGRDLSGYLGGNSCDDRSVLRIEQGLRKLDDNVRKIDREAEEYVEKNPDAVDAIQARWRHKLVKVEAERAKLESDLEKLLAKNDTHARKKMKKMEYIVIENL